jgi:hypothetical protein
MIKCVRPGRDFSSSPQRGMGRGLLSVGGFFWSLMSNCASGSASVSAFLSVSVSAFMPVSLSASRLTFFLRQRK